MLRVSIRCIRPGKEARLREWLAELGARADEVRATFVDETVRAEQAFIVPGPDGPLLVCVVEAEDFEQGARAFAASAQAIDHEHRAVLRECVGDSLGLEPSYEVRL